MEKLIVLDRTDQHIDIYNIENDFDLTEDFLTFLGHDVDYCNWMICKELNIVEHKGIYIKNGEQYDRKED